MFMKLGKLLSAGSSIFGGAEPAAYHLNKMGLPKFNAGKNPFISDPPAAVPAAPKVEAKISAPAAAAEVQQAPDQPAAPPARTGWVAKLNPFRAPAPVAPPQPAAVQPEFLLDAVKVVHNDLTDADVEIVPVKSHVEAPVAAPMLPPARRDWEFLGESVLKSG